jgi:hypothetical protein
MRIPGFVVVLGALLLAGCGSGSSTSDTPTLRPPLAASELPELAARDRELPLEALAADAFEPEELAALLDDAGYEGGRERELSGHTDTFDHVIARSLVFADATGADTYLGWVRSHTIDLVGRTREREALALGDTALLFELEPCPTCKKQLPTLVAAWRSGGSVGYVLASGRGLNRESFGRLALAVEASVVG